MLKNLVPRILSLLTWPEVWGPYEWAGSGPFGEGVGYPTPQTQPFTSGRGAHARWLLRRAPIKQHNKTHRVSWTNKDGGGSSSDRARVEKQGALVCVCVCVHYLVGRVCACEHVRGNLGPGLAGLDLLENNPALGTAWFHICPTVRLP